MCYNKNRKNKGDKNMAKQLVNTKTNKVIFEGTKQQIIDYVIANYGNSVWIKNNLNHFTIKSFGMAITAMWCIDLDVI